MNGHDHQDEMGICGLYYHPSSQKKKVSERKLLFFNLGTRIVEFNITVDEEYVTTIFKHGERRCHLPWDFRYELQSIKERFAKH